MQSDPTQKKKNWASHQKTWYGKWHVWLGLIAGTIIFIVSLTGTMLVYRDEIDRALNPELLTVTPQGDKLSFQQIAEQLKRDHPKWKLEFIFRGEGGDESRLAYQAHREGTEDEIYVNPYTGKVLGSREHDTHLMGFILEIHRTLLIPAAGRYIVGLAALMLVILTISGLRLWIPRQWKYLKAHLGIKRGASFTRQNYDLHQVLGLYSAPMVLLIALTGVVITFLVVIAPVMFLLSFEKPKSLDQLINSKSVYAKGAQTIDANTAIAKALKTVPAKAQVRGIIFPRDTTGTFAVYTTSPHTLATGDNDFVYVDQYSGKINLSTATGLPNTGKMYLNWVTPVHYGTFGGPVTRVLALLASLVSSILFVTGIIIWWPRWRGKNKKKGKRNREKAASISALTDPKLSE